MKSVLRWLFRLMGYEVKKTTRIQTHQECSKTSILDDLPQLRSPFCDVPFAGQALQKLIDDYEFKTVLDIGAGGLEHSLVFALMGKKVTAVDYGNSIYHQRKTSDAGIELIIGDFNAIDISGTFDCIWASHVLEHQVDVNTFLKKIKGLLKTNGILVLTVPPLKHEIVGGHVSLWNAGLILYRLVLAGFDCSQASVLQYGYNISVIIRKSDILQMPELHFDAGDIRRLRAYFPSGLKYKTDINEDPFDGDIKCLNW